MALLMLAGPLAGGVARADDEDETPQVAESLETRSYTRAATREVLGQWSFVVGEVDRFPGDPTPKQVKDASLRKRLLDLRLMMDFNAFAYKPGSFDNYRELVDVAYEAIGEYKDLFDTQSIDGFAIDPVDRDRRFNAMINAVAPLRQADLRAKFEKSVDRFEDDLVDLDFDERPRLWQIAKIEPTDNLDSAGNAARLGHEVLANLRSDGLLVDDIFNSEQEERFHDVRKALRSVLVLTDMFPSLSAAVGDAREPLADLVKAYGKANDQVVAYHEAQSHGRPLDERAAALSEAFAKAQQRALQFDQTGQLDAFAASLSIAQESHGR